MDEELNQDPMDEQELEAAMEAELRRQAEAESVAEFGELPAGGPDGHPQALSMLYDLNMPVALSLGRGSVIQLDRLAGEPIDVFVGDRRFAEGEVVVVGEQFGVRITRILGKGADGSQEAVA